jgi:hypothetical protein
MISSFVIIYEGKIEQASEGMNNPFGGLIGAFCGNSASRLSPDEYFVEEI